jgi:sulfite exporter TauE/SafE
VISIVAGFLAGTIHVLSGPDHLAAVAPLSVESPRSGWRIGMRWGFGHAGGVLCVGLIALLLREVLPIHVLSDWAERLVGVVLIGLGLWGLHKAFQNHLHVHEHTHDGESHRHVHVHSHGHSSSRAAQHSHTHTAFAIGTLHGFAGSSHFLGVLPALAFPSKAEAIIYLSAYGFGTVVAMTGFSSAIGLLSQGILHRGGLAYRSLMVAISAGAVGVGSYWLLA